MVRTIVILIDKKIHKQELIITVIPYFQQFNGLYNVKNNFFIKKSNLFRCIGSII